VKHSKTNVSRKTYKFHVSHETMTIKAL